MEKEFKPNLLHTAINTIQHGILPGACIALSASVICKNFYINGLFISFLIGFMLGYIICFIYGITSKIKVTSDEIIISNLFKNRHYSILSVVDIISERVKSRYWDYIDKRIYIIESNTLKIEHCNFLNKESFEELDTTIKRVANLKDKTLKKEEEKYIPTESKTFCINNEYKENMSRYKKIILSTVLVFLTVMLFMVVFGFYRNDEPIAFMFIFIMGLGFIAVPIIWEINSKFNKPIINTPKVITVYSQGIKFDDDYYNYDAIETIYMQSINSINYNNYYTIKIKTQTNKLTFCMGIDDKKIYFEIYDLIAKYAHLKLKNETD